MGLNMNKDLLVEYIKQDLYRLMCNPLTEEEIETKMLNQIKELQS
jgi:hypothetical protein